MGNGASFQSATNQMNQGMQSLPPASQGAMYASGIPTLFNMISGNENYQPPFMSQSNQQPQSQPPTQQSPQQNRPTPDVYQPQNQPPQTQQPQQNRPALDTYQPSNQNQPPIQTQPYQPPVNPIQAQAYQSPFQQPYWGTGNQNYSPFGMLGFYPYWM